MPVALSDFDIHPGSGKLGAPNIRGGFNGRILHEMQDEARDSQPGTSDIQERQTCDPGNLLGLWNQGVPNRERLADLNRASGDRNRSVKTRTWIKCRLWVRACMRRRLREG